MTGRLGCTEDREYSPIILNKQQRVCCICRMTSKRAEPVPSDDQPSKMHELALSRTRVHRSKSGRTGQDGFPCRRCAFMARRLRYLNTYSYDTSFRHYCYKCKKNCCFITMCKAHSKVTHIKQQKYFHHLKRSGYNTEFLLYPRPFR